MPWFQGERADGRVGILAGGPPPARRSPNPTHRAPGTARLGAVGHPLSPRRRTRAAGHPDTHALLCVLLPNAVVPGRAGERVGILAGGPPQPAAAQVLPTSRARGPGESSFLPAPPASPTPPSPSHTTGTWGVPVNISDNAGFPAYVNAIERLGRGGEWGKAAGGGGGSSANVTPSNSFTASPLPKPTPPPTTPVVADVVLVDGRFRVAVALKALWHINAASVVLMHDWPRRQEAYGRVLVYYDVVDAVDDLVVLARKPDLDWAAAAADLAVYVDRPARL